MLILQDAMCNASEEAKNRGAVGESPSGFTSGDATI